MDVPDLKSEVPDLKSEGPDLRSGWIRLNDMKEHLTEYNATKNSRPGFIEGRSCLKNLL